MLFYFTEKIYSFFYTLMLCFMCHIGINVLLFAITIHSKIKNNKNDANPTKSELGELKEHVIPIPTP